MLALNFFQQSDCAHTFKDYTDMFKVQRIKRFIIASVYLESNILRNQYAL